MNVILTILSKYFNLVTNITQNLLKRAKCYTFQVKFHLNYPVNIYLHQFIPVQNIFELPVSYLIHFLKLAQTNL